MGISSSSSRSTRSRRRDTHTSDRRPTQLRLVELEREALQPERSHRSWEPETHQRPLDGRQIVEEFQRKVLRLEESDTKGSRRNLKTTGSSSTRESRRTEFSRDNPDRRSHSRGETDYYKFSTPQRDQSGDYYPPAANRRYGRGRPVSDKSYSRDQGIPRPDSGVLPAPSAAWIRRQSDPRPCSRPTASASRDSHSFRETDRRYGQAPPASKPSYFRDHGIPRPDSGVLPAPSAAWTTSMRQSERRSASRMTTGDARQHAERRQIERNRAETLEALESNRAARGSSNRYPHWV